MEDRAPARFRAVSPRAVVALGVGLLVLLGLVAAASRAHHTPGGHAGIHQPPSGVGDYLFSIFAVLLVSVALLFFYLWFSERDMLAEARKRRQSKGRYRLLIVLLLILGLAPALRSRLNWFGRHSRGARPAKVHPGTPQKTRARGPSGGLTERPPHFKWLPVLIATATGVALLGFIGVHALRRSRRELGRRFVLEQELEALLDDTLDDLHAMKDPRAAIIAAYARMERALALVGVGRDAAEAPFEYLERSLLELDASADSARRLTELFERAKFSHHEPDEPMRGEAIDALAAVRDELRAAAAEPAAA